jgi:pyrroloquinoline quinone biosynthesis protein D
VIPQGVRPRLARKARVRPDQHTGGTLLLLPEKGLALNETARQIVTLCTGESTVDEIIDRLAALAGAPPRDEVAVEVNAFLTALMQRGLLRWDSP